MPVNFKVGDLVWCQKKQSNFLPGKIALEKKSGKWEKENQLFVELLHLGKNLLKGQWYNTSDICPFTDHKDCKFTNASLRKALNQAKNALKTNRATTTLITCILFHYRVFNSMLINIEIFLIYKSLVLKRNKHILLTYLLS